MLRIKVNEPLTDVFVLRWKCYSVAVNGVDELIFPGGGDGRRILTFNYENDSGLRFFLFFLAAFQNIFDGEEVSATSD